MSNMEINIAKINVTKEITKTAIIGGLACFIMSFLINYFLIPMPADQTANAVGNGISGLGSGVMTAVCGMGMFFLSLKKAGEKEKPKQDPR